LKQIIQRGSSITHRSCVAIATCKKQLFARLTTSIAKQPHHAFALGNRRSLYSNF